jgi:hypothetical protein
VKIRIYPGARSRLVAARLAGEPATLQATACLTPLIKGGCAPLAVRLIQKSALAWRPAWPGVPGQADALAAARCQSSVALPGE